MEQSTLNRGHLAFLEDMTHSAAEAFRANEMKDVRAILVSIQNYINQFLAAADPQPN